MRELATVAPRSPREMGGVLQNLGQRLATAGRFDEARQSFEMSLNLLPGQAGCHFDLANVLYGAGMVESAITEYHHAIQLDPRFAGPGTTWVLR